MPSSLLADTAGPWAWEVGGHWASPTVAMGAGVGAGRVGGWLGWWGPVPQCSVASGPALRSAAVCRTAVWARGAAAGGGLGFLNCEDALVERGGC